MGIFSRISDIISANLNDMVEGFEDPEKMLRQAIREMQDTIDQATRSTAKNMASAQMVQKELEKNRSESNVWTNRAEKAVADGNDDLARKAIARKQEHEKLAAALEDQLATSQQTTQKLRRQLEAMRAKLSEAKRRLATLTARKHVADLRSKVNKVSDSVSPNTSAFAKFERMRDALIGLSGPVRSVCWMSRPCGGDFSLNIFCNRLAISRFEGRTSQYPFLSLLKNPSFFTYNGVRPPRISFSRPKCSPKTTIWVTTRPAIHCRIS